MPLDTQFAAGRFERFLSDVLLPAVHPDAEPLAVEVATCADPISLAEARQRAFTPVSLGWEWGPVWSTAWFRVRGEVPHRMAGKRVALRFSSMTEALVWRNEAPWQGLDLNRDTVLITDSARGGEPIDEMIEAACNHALGQVGLHWDHAEFHKRWKSPKPGRLERCEVAVVDPIAWRLAWAYRFALELMKELPKESARGQELLGSLRRATNLVDDLGVAGTAGRALAVIEASLGRRAGGSTPICHAVGHAHIDTAWLWPIRETKRKCLRTFATAIRNLERSMDFRFLCSQAQQYAWVEEGSPELFAKIRSMVDAGRWEPGGAMWIESDCNLVSGESLVRQIIHGTRYWESKFGERGRQRFLYLPDTFGFSAAIPQIMKLAGLDTFITHKLSWNQTNVWPATNFAWRGLDGTEVVSHCMPGHDYNLLMSPRELRRGERVHENKDLGVAAGPGGETASCRYLQPYGYGDGGGGPTEWQILYAELAKDCEGVPRVRHTSVSAFCDALHADRSSSRQLGESWPVWDGELYLEAHRGTYTTQAAVKRGNRRAEAGLRAAEIATWGLAGRILLGNAATTIEAEQDRAWKLTLLNQFHDIIPGSSIGWVYEDAAKDHAEVAAIADQQTRDAVALACSRVSARGMAEPYVVVNATSSPVSGVVDLGGSLGYVESIPSISIRAVDRAAAAKTVPSTGPVVINGTTLTNGVISATIDARGQVSSLSRCASGYDVASPDRPLNQLWMYEDRPRHWEAWDIDPEYKQKGWLVDAPATVRAEQVSPLRGSVVVERMLSKQSRIIQRYTLEAGSPRLDIRTTIEWRDQRRLLRALFPTALRARSATYETQFGHLQRPTHRNTSWEQAAYEAPAQRWMDLSDEGLSEGLAVLNDCKYGHSCEGGTLGLSLVRSPIFPDESADLGTHELTYSLMPHGGDWRGAKVDHQAELLNQPLMAQRHSGVNSAGGVEWAPFKVETTRACHVEVTAVKPGLTPSSVVVRVVETHGRTGNVRLTWTGASQRMRPVDLLERPMGLDGFASDPKTGSASWPMAPFQIVTIEVGGA